MTGRSLKHIAIIQWFCVEIFSENVLLCRRRQWIKTWPIIFYLHYIYIDEFLIKNFILHVNLTIGLQRFQVLHFNLIVY